MGTSELFNAYFQQVAKNAAQGRTPSTGTASPLRSYSLLNNSKPQQPSSGVEGGFSAGQSLIDILSTTSYGTAGVVNKIGQNLRAAGRGEIGGLLDLFNPLSTPGAFQKGIAEKRSNIQNLVDAGMSEQDAAGLGLAMDIALDPLWLVPGGAIAAGAKGTIRGGIAAAGATRAGVTLSKPAFEEAGKRLAQERGMGLGKEQVTPTTEQAIKGLSPLRATQAEPIKDLFPVTGVRRSNLSTTGLSNLVQGIRQGNVENYAEWAALRKVNKASTAIRRSKESKWYLPGSGTDAPLDRFERKYNITPEMLFRNADAAVAAAAAKAADDIIEGTSTAATKPNLEADIPNQANEAAEAAVEAVESKASTKLAKDTKKDIDAPVEAAENAIEKAGVAGIKSINAKAREVLDPFKNKFLKTRGMDAPAFTVDSFVNVKAAPIAGDIGKLYDEAKSDPTNPEVLASYNKAAEEVEDQYDFLTKDPEGPQIDVQFVDENPYLVRDSSGDMVTSSKLFMEDIVENKRLLVYKTADDQAHPVWSNDINDKFRAVHDFFGHAASGRGVLKDGEEAAWISHSTMFSELARRAMTTETRGQNSWVNRYGLDETGKPVRYAEQKAFLMPDAYVMLPDEYAKIEGQVLPSNGLKMRSVAVIENLNDVIMDKLEMVSSPLRSFEYTQENFNAIRKVRDQITDVEFVRPGTDAHKEVLNTLGEMKNRISNSARLNRIAGDFEKLANSLKGESGLALRKILNTPVDATDLLTAAAKAEGRSLTLPPAFKPIEWAPKATYGKPDFSIKDLEKYFPNDPLVNDIKNLDIAMGSATTGVRAAKGETKAQAFARKQQRIWEDFRVRNADLLQDAVSRQKTEWDATYAVPDSNVFLSSKVLGSGKLPLGLPQSALGSLNGVPTVNLAKLLSSIQSTIIREPVRVTQGLGDLGLTIASELKKKVNVTRKQLDEEGNPVKIDELFSEVPGDQVLVAASGAVRGAEFKVVDANGKKIPNWLETARAGGGIPAGSTIEAVNDAAKEVMVRLRRLKPQIEIDRIPPVISDWVTKQLDTVIKNVSKSPVRVSRAVDQMSPEGIAGLARKLMDAVPAVKTFDDAKIFITNFDGAIASLAKKPSRKIYIKKEEMLPTRGDRKPAVDRDLETGLPLADAKPYSLSVFKNEIEEGINLADRTILTRTGKQATASADAKGATRDKTNRLYESQLTGSKEQLASVANVQKGLDIVAGAAARGELPTSPEQLDLLRSVLGTLGKKVAPDASPKEVFKEFQSARMLYEETIGKIESAAKREAVIIAAPRSFSKSVEENIAIMEAIEKTDPGAMQRQVTQLTELAVDTVDYACRANSAIRFTPPSQFLNEI
jgi:hypothetical protein